MTFKERQPRDKGVITENRLLELHLYPGNQCNRDCSFCTVFGSPKGWYREYTAEHLDAVLQTVRLDDQGAIKFYGGEPTLDHENVIWAIAYLRQHQYQGAIVIYSNGIQSERLLQILESDPLGKTTASLNYSIATGDGAPPMPQKALEQLEAYEQNHPQSIAIGHPDVVDSGRGIDPFTGEASRPKANSRCPHCYPVLTTEGKFHACPFAIENQALHFQLGSTNSDTSEVLQNFQEFFRWLDTVHEPYASTHNLPACTVCWKHLDQLPMPSYASHLRSDQGN
ncbi:radical SAM protein [Leptolyngbya ohadii]|uniref:radical SAM protein n=1 Tax=Leptolyngbya ohadii TaxID=1962290 RepID=UPI000B59E04C|nr:radical SAM protein [Leptolyngbya ohadii]